jgi:hypothetical protein
MSWFKKSPPNLVVSPPPASRVEVELHKSANKAAVEKAKGVNKHLNDLLEENGFTIKIALAAGRKNIRRKGH